jgi:N-acyl-D-amino-acid deacylase
MTSTVIQGAVVANGSGGDPVRIDIRFDQEAILELGSGIARPGDRVIEASGRVVMPGFIDPHVHASPIIDSATEMEPLVAQGVTSVILGGDGFAYGGGTLPALRFTEEYFGGIDGPMPPDLDGTLGSLLSPNRSSIVNVGALVPANTVRYSVMGAAQRASTESERELMVEMVHRGMQEGALGLGTGFEYVPGLFSSDAEVAEMCNPVKQWGGVHASHLRGYGAAISSGISALTSIQQVSGVRSHISHLRALATDALPALEEAGLEVTFDTYPYQRGCTLLAMKFLPGHVQARSTAEAVSWLRESSDWQLMLGAPDGVGEYVLSSSGDSALSDLCGTTLAAGADSMGTSLAAFVREVLIHSRLAATCIVPAGSVADTEDDYRRLLTDPRNMACSDGIYVGEHPHPRGWGAFARVLGRHVRVLRDLTLGQAARHLSGAAAEAFGLSGRGAIAVGNHADLVVVDAETVTDEATYASPTARARGIDSVFINGTEVFRHGAMTGARAGEPLRLDREGRHS